MDPLEACLVDVFDLIFQHFNYKDVIRCSLVSQSWNEIIGSSHSCMKHVWLKIDKPVDQVHYLEHSQRKYENFRIQPGARGKLAQVFKNFRTRNAMITDDHGEEIDHDDYFKFLEAMAMTVEDLQPGEAFTINAKNFQALDFPKLKELQYTLTNRSAFSIFLGSNPKLERVLLSFSNVVPAEFLYPNNIIYVFLQRNPQIRSLWMCEVYDAFASDMTQNVRLDLETFAFAITNLMFSEENGENLVKFIKLQKNLEWLKILCLYDKKVFMRIWNEGHFKKLFIMDCSLKGTMHNQELPSNLQLEEINFYLNPSCHILKFLRASPNVKAIKVRQLSKQIMEFSAQHLHKLELIKYQSVESDVEKFYQSLKASDEADVNRGIKLEEMDFFEFVGRDAGF